MAHRRYRVHHHHHRRRHNAFGYHRRRHHRNPFGFDRSTLTTAAWGTVGAAGARFLPATFMPAQNTGFMGYALNALAALALKFAGDSVLGKSEGDALFAGGLIGTGLRIVQEQFGSKIAGLSGDAGFNLGAYWQSYFALPTVSDPYGRTSASPYPQPALPAAAGGGGMGRFTGRFRSGVMR